MPLRVTRLMLGKNENRHYGQYLYAALLDIAEKALHYKPSILLKRLRKSSLDTDSTVDVLN